ncbi:cyanophycinase [Candidatus Uabimicrobium amorphum]|uniref:Cyanophycinase n=1 Tax=Uabimicrobium amorphum TaxID=2596890 RepID=A0A5S9F191_UABAM|nr:cyanophycinase [Candidatus Uabimicrobium amorphum]BBM82142.1 cyanophycinase [Candidatus Uabimicrobium amorphum]
MTKTLQIISIFVICSVTISAQSSLQNHTVNYDCYVTGNPHDVKVKTTPGLGLQGGGGDEDAMMRFLISKAKGGDFLVLRTSGSDGYNDYVWDFGGVDSVTTLVIKNKEASKDPFVISTIRNAEVIFFSGGDQSKYQQLWQNTEIQRLILHKFANGTPMGGTSAGAMIMSEYFFTARNGSVYSDEMLDDPYNRYATLDKNFLSLVEGVIIDTHFRERDRMGRLVGFLARIATDWKKKSKAIALQTNTAIFIEADNNVRVYAPPGEHVYFVKPDGLPEHCKSQDALTYREISVCKITQGTFNLKTWQGDGDVYRFSAIEGRLFPKSPY